jgi:hypothetical protein
MADYLPQAPTGQAGHGHEANTLVVRGLIMFAVVLIAVGLVVEFSLVYIMKDFSNEEKTQDALASPLLEDKSGTFPAPRLQSEPPTDLVRFKEAELRRLNGYGWVNREAGIAHIPVDRAIEIVVSKGLPTSGVPAERADAVSPPGRQAEPEAKGGRKP